MVYKITRYSRVTKKAGELRIDESVNVQISAKNAVDWEMQKRGSILAVRRIFTPAVLYVAQISKFAIGTLKRCTFCSLRFLILCVRGSEPSILRCTDSADFGELLSWSLFSALHSQENRRTLNR
jgi:hypothetical protein